MGGAAAIETNKGSFDHGDAGLWTLVWRRFRRDHIGVVSLGVVLLFVLLTETSGLGLVAGDWAEEVGTSNAPPEFLGTDRKPAPGTPTATGSGATNPAPTAAAIKDPLADTLAEIRGGEPASSQVQPPTENPDIVDPLAD